MVDCLFAALMCLSEYLC